MARRRRKGGPSQRQLRVAELLKHALAETLERETLHDRDLAGVTITVTEVDMGPDLRSATVYVMPLGGGDVPAILAGLNRGASFLRNKVTGTLSLKFSPKLRFEIDPSFDQANRIEALLRSPRVARDLADEPVTDPPEQGVPDLLPE